MEILKKIENHFYCFYKYGNNILSFNELSTIDPSRYKIIKIEIHYIYDAAAYVIYNSTLHKLLNIDDPLEYLFKLTDKYD